MRPPPEPTGLDRVASGTLWSLLNAVTSIVLPFSVFAFFARVVPPWQFGLVGLALAWAEIVKVLCPSGLYEALLGQEPDDARHRSAATVLAGSAAIAYLVFVVCLYVATSHIRGSATILPALALLGFRLVFDMLLLQPMARLIQQGSAAKLARRFIAANLLATVTGLSIGLMLPLMGLIAYYLTQTILVFALTVAGTQSWAWFTRDLSALRSMRRDAIAASSARGVGAINGYFDQILIGALLPIRAVADFNVGKRVENALVTGGNSFCTILFQPLFVDRGTNRLVAVERSAAILHVLLAVPVAVFVANCDLLVPWLFGPQWAAAAPVAAALAVCGLLRAYAFIFLALLSVSRRNDAIVRSSLTMAVLGTLAVIGASYHGLLAVAIALVSKNGINIFYLAWQGRIEVPDLPKLTLRAVLLPLPLILISACLISRLPVLTAAGSTIAGLFAVLLSGAVAGLVALLLSRAHVGVVMAEVRGHRLK